MPEKTTAELMDEYYKKHPGKRPLMRRLADQRKANAAEKAKYNAIYREEFNKQRAKSLKAKAKQEAIDKYRPTRKQKMDRFANSIGSLGGVGGFGATTPQKQKQSSSKNKQKFTIVGGKAYPIAKQHQQSRTHQKKKKKKTSSDPFDLGGLDNIGDFNF